MVDIWKHGPWWVFILQLTWQPLLWPFEAAWWRMLYFSSEVITKNSSQKRSNKVLIVIYIFDSILFFIHIHCLFFLNLICNNLRCLRKPECSPVRQQFFCVVCNLFLCYEAKHWVNILQVRWFHNSCQGLYETMQLINIWGVTAMVSL